MRVFISDCEGPISKNDNAFELTSHFVPDGDKIFTVISRYDDVLADIVKRRGHRAGATLKLVLPFLKAYDVTDEAIERCSAEKLVLIPSSKDTMQHARTIAPAFIVSTSYEHYIKALCRTIKFPFENTYCTKFSIDRYSITTEERAKLRKIIQEIARMQVFEIPQNAKSLKDFSASVQDTIRRLDQIFWNEIAEMKIGRIYVEVEPVGGQGKAEAIKDVVHRLRISFSDVMYVGDSITDQEAFRLVKERSGLTVSFNGNEYAIQNAEVAVMSEHSAVTAILADIFIKHGKEEALNIAEKWSREELEKSPADQGLVERLFKLYPSKLPKVKIITTENMEILAKESIEFRKRVRGEAIGGLG